MINRFLVIFIFLFGLQFYPYAQETGKELPPTPFEKKQKYKNYNVAQFLHESVLFLKQPIVWDKNDWTNVGGMIATTLAIMPFDPRLRDATQGEQKYYNSFPIEAGRYYGDWYAIAALTTAFGGYGIIARDTAYKKLAIELFQTGVYAELITGILKVSFGRARPRTGSDQFTYKPFNFNDDYNSLPSGHTTLAFSLSTVLSRHAKTTFLKILAYLPAGLTMFSRIYQNNHWFSDEIIAAATGYFVGNWVVDLHEGKRHPINVVAFTPFPTIRINLNKDPAEKHMIKKFM